MPADRPSPQGRLIVGGLDTGDRYPHRAGVLRGGASGAVIIRTAAWITQQRIGGKNLPKLLVGTRIRRAGATVRMMSAQLAPIRVRDLGLGRSRRHAEHGVRVSHVGTPRLSATPAVMRGVGARYLVILRQL